MKQICPKCGVIQTIEAFNRTADIITFADPNFEKVVREILNKPDGDITKADVEEITEFDVSGSYSYKEGKRIADISEIKYFINLKKLDCSDNGLIELDVSNNQALEWLDCGNSGQIDSELSNNPEFMKLYNEHNLTFLDVSNNPALKYLRCSCNNLTELDVSNNPELEELRCSANKITKLDLSKNPKLKDLTSKHSELTELVLSNNPVLTHLDFHYSRVSKLDISGCPALKSFYCGYNDLTELDVSGCPALEWLHCGENQLTKLDVSGNSALDWLAFGGNKLIELNIDNNTVWECFGYGNTPFPEIDVKIMTNFQIFQKKCRKNNFFACEIFLKNNTLEFIRNDIDKLNNIDEEQVLYFIGIYGRLSDNGHYFYNNMDTNWSMCCKSSGRGNKFPGIYWIFRARILNKLIDIGVDKKIVDSLIPQLYEYYDSDEALKSDEKNYQKFKEIWQKQINGLTEKL